MDVSERATSPSRGHPHEAEAGGPADVRGRHKRGGRPTARGIRGHLSPLSGGYGAVDLEALRRLKALDGNEGGKAHGRGWGAGGITIRCGVLSRRSAELPLKPSPHRRIKRHHVFGSARAARFRASRETPDAIDEARNDAAQPQDHLHEEAALGHRTRRSDRPAV